MSTSQIPKTRKVLVIEDEPDIAALLELHLRDHGWEVSLARDGHEGMRLVFARQWDLVILDLRLPGPDGLQICRSLRREQNYVPVLMLTSKSSELDRVLGLELGADDYLTKPFSVSELVARVKAIFRRVDSISKNHGLQSEKLETGDLVIDPQQRLVSVDGQAVMLTAREFDLLLHFMRQPGRVFSRAQLLDAVWGFGHEGYEHTVNSHINRLRAKIEHDPSHPEHIVTVWGVGYKLEPAGRPGRAN
ncbi:MAG TPA: response regulator transcription factor [Xanthomonadales bacterium]|nr:response regulator transcription factor [Xanthomonadales bacterium]